MISPLFLVSMNKDYFKHPVSTLNNVVLNALLRTMKNASDVTTYVLLTHNTCTYARTKINDAEMQQEIGS